MVVTVGLMMIMLLVACGGGESEGANDPIVAESAPENTPTATAMVVAEAAPTDVPTAVPTVAPTEAPTVVPTVAPTAIPTAESVDMAACLVGTWDYANLQEAMEGMIKGSMPPEIADEVAITTVNGRLFIIFGADGVATAGAEGLSIGMAIMGTETQTAVEAAGSIAYSVDGNMIFTDLTDYDSTGTETTTGTTVVFDIGTMMAAGETGEAVSTFICEGDALQFSNDNLPVPLELERAD